MDDPKGEPIARELASQLAALLTPEPPGSASPSDRRATPPADGPLPSLAGPRTILENGARFSSPVLPADTRFRAGKALILRALRIVTRDQTVFNAAVAEALRAGLSETESLLRSLASRAAASERKAGRLEEWTQGQLREALDAIRRVEDRGLALVAELAGDRQQAAAARDELQAGLASETAARQADARRLAEQLAGELAREGGAREALGRELLATQRRADLLEEAARLLREAVDREATARTALGAEHHGTQRRLDVVEALGARRDRDLDREAAAREALADRVHETQRRVDAVEIRGDEVRPRLVEAERRAEGVETELRALERSTERPSEELRAARLEWSALRAILRKGETGAGAVPIVAAAPTGPLRAAPAPDPLSAGLYADFERQFRGDEAEIRRRQAEDVALLAAAPGPVADLGCGRGELLEALGARGVPALGCDSNPVMVARCREKGLSVEEADLFAFLSAQPDGSLGGVTAYQVVEHLPPEALVPLVDLAAAKLAPGGRLLFETVNPESLYAMRWFWMDLTHVRPVPGPSLAQLLSAAGFRDVTVRYRAEVPESVSGPLAAVTDPVLGAAARLLFAPQDVVVTGVR